MAAVLLSATLSSCSIRTHDEIECGLPEGSSFILRSSYDWYPLARFVPHTAERLNESGILSYYKVKSSRIEIGPTSAVYGIRDYDNPQLARQRCAMYGLINKAPYKALTSYKAPGSSTFTRLNQDRDLFFSASLGGNPPNHIRDALKRLKASYGGSAIIWRPEKVIIEIALETEDSSPPLTVAVYRIESLDGGQTWTNPHVTTETEAFELGRTFDEQCFIARLIRIDDRRFKPDFPDCPVAFALPERKQ
ncbi:hypothetical protein IAI53_02135 [Thauera sp. CAU 1555]|uniref:Lipoprotein n=1 Tax=Thauera sedimentorum TaxID=2767595 RepID=A0ABR9B654_9RHOO|nr:hypothetical protein [Thauera sedimentorum]MBC9070752.1 hypothetical protein [Thauera sedimentorum]MBD8501671.1 hypothetical protein [Thauera sedimentorum]